MKKIFTCTSILMSILIIQSCSKEAAKEMLVSPETSTTTVNATVKSNGMYQLNLDNLENVVIAKQASHFQISEAGLDNKTGLLVYKYQPALDYTGLDEVLLSSSKKVVSTMTGGCHNNNGNAYHASTTATTAVTSNISIKISVAKD
ncbi:MAG: hypothetical protein ABJA71_09040 [Ginsengibacter sp.]